MQASVKVANGHLLQCSEAVMNCGFSLGDFHFQHDLRILPLDSYDLNLGIDWLEKYSPMEVHWQAKWLSIPYKGDTILLQGLITATETELVVQVLAVDISEDQPIPASLPPDIAALLEEFPTVFRVPNSLPPKRACDHAIPIISGATPVNIRAYRYPPNLKDEIERQVNTMLNQGLIQPSKSLF
jgi:hypothetical protein